MGDSSEKGVIHVRFLQARDEKIQGEHHAHPELLEIVLLEFEESLELARAYVHAAGG
jgi:NTP pyrophosphatase (non-canonical NTP hydrolase)